MLGKLLIRYLRPYGWLLVGVLVFQFVSALASAADASTAFSPLDASSAGS